MTNFEGKVTKLKYGSVSLQVLEGCCGVLADHNGNEIQVSVVFVNTQNGFISFVSFLSEGHRRDYESAHPELEVKWHSFSNYFRDVGRHKVDEGFVGVVVDG